MDSELPFKEDRRGLLYLDSKDIIVKPLFVNQIRDAGERRARFFSIDGVDDYIIKDCTEHPGRFNRSSNLKLLRKLTKRQELIEKTEFPIGYYQEENKLKGLVIPYYEGSISLRELTSILHTFDDLSDYYNQDSNKIDNLVALLLEILEVISDMYYGGVYYLDINSGNFLIYNNSVKVVDFEPGKICFNDRDFNLKLILCHYALLVDRIRRCYHLHDDISFHSGIDFYNTEHNVKVLGKRMKGFYGI